MTKNLSIGMSKAQVMQGLKNVNLTASIKEKIGNFWANDRDGKITNEIELAMLDRWASGSEKIKMPTSSKEPFKVNQTNYGSVSVFSKTYVSDSNNGIIYSPETADRFTRTHYSDRDASASENACSTRATWLHEENGKVTVDMLFDEDCDGIADGRAIIIDEYDVNNKNVLNSERYEDKNLDGKLEEENF